jgi:hypothetical protein
MGSSAGFNRPSAWLKAAIVAVRAWSAAISAADQPT